MKISNTINIFLRENVSIAPLISFRIVFGLIMLFASFRNLSLGFVEKFYILPIYHFKYYGFEWVQPLGFWGTYIAYAIMIIAALGICLGAFYRISALLFFLIFTYFELMDVTHYLNHYYLVSLLAFVLCFLPANRAYSIDAAIKPQIKQLQIPRWTILLIQYQIALLYIYAGIAKLQPDWLLYGQPLKIWLGRQSDFPIMGNYLALPLTAYIFSWVAAFYDLCIPLLLWHKKSRLAAYLAVIAFHLLTAMLFNIGIFPIAMIGFAIIFFSGLWHHKIISNFALVFILTLSKLKQKNKTSTPEHHTIIGKKVPWFIYIFAVWQLIFPLRHWLYPGNVLWTEEGFRFSWKVMVVEKSAHAAFTIKDEDGKTTEVENRDFLTEKQEVFMSYQPDMMLQYAHFLAEYYKHKGFKSPKVYVDCHVSLNGRVSRRFIDPKTDLSKENAGIHHKPWVILYRDL